MSGTQTVTVEHGAGGGAATGTPQPAAVIIEEPVTEAGADDADELGRLTEATRRAETERDAARRDAAAATAQLRHAERVQQEDQVTVLTAAVEANRIAADAAAHEWQSAMEAGDWAAAATAQGKQQIANSRLDRASSELEIAKASTTARGTGGDRQQQQQRQQQPADNISEASRRWIDSHPEFNTHRQALIAKHAALLVDGLQPDSPAYFRELDAEYARLTGGGNRGGTGNGGGDMQGNRGGGFGGAPPSRGGGGGGNQTVRTELGEIGVTERNGQTVINIPQHLREVFEEGAKVTGFMQKDGRTPDVAGYAMEHVKIARERAAGGTGGLITSEGRSYR